MQCRGIVPSLSNQDMWMDGLLPIRSVFWLLSSIAAWGHASQSCACMNVAEVDGEVDLGGCYAVLLQA